MAKDPEDLLKMSDHDLMYWALSGTEDSYCHKIGETAINMRTALKMLGANDKMVAANNAVAIYTKRLAVSSWAIVAITLLTQIALIYLTASK